MMHEGDLYFRVINREMTNWWEAGAKHAGERAGCAGRNATVRAEHVHEQAWAEGARAGVVVGGGRRWERAS